MELLLFLVIAIFSVGTGTLVDYSDLQALGAACPPKDTCSSSAGRTFYNSSCECDNWCHSFDDCCVDAPAARSPNGSEKRLGITCLETDYFRGVYVIAKCRSSWTGSNEVRRRCEDEDDFSYPLMSVPSTDIRTNVTYRNHYCAECNYGSIRNFSPWNVALTCSSLEELYNVHNNITADFIAKNLVQSEGSWGVYQWNETLGAMTFYPCEVSFILPDGLKPHVRFCRPQVISTCVADWNRDVVRRNCLEYMAVIYINNRSYRNAHCAVCNHVSVRNRVCNIPGYSSRKPPLSFTLLMDVNPSDGDAVGETNPCSSGETYDPYAKACRKLVCALPGHDFINGRCVPR